MRDIFEAQLEENNTALPLAERIRPATLEDVVGQEHLLGQGKLLREAIEDDRHMSLLFWGPPGSGKTTLARIIAKKTKSEYQTMSAVNSGVKDINEVVKKAKETLSLYRRRTILFVDEIHRFNKSQQDAFLPHVEDGSIILIGATTENPSFELNSALLSRLKVLVLNPLKTGDINVIINRVLDYYKNRGLIIIVGDKARVFLCSQANGDARSCINTLEAALSLLFKNNDKDGELTISVIEEAMQKRMLQYDKSGEEHYNLISALHKSIRGSDPQAALYWFYRMIEGGEDPMYLARRLVRVASEDVGNADPQSLVLAVAARDAFHFLGAPEGILAIAQIVAYLATAPKSNSIYMAEDSIKSDIKMTGNLPVPLHIRNAPTKLMKELDYGKGYKYDHDEKKYFSAQDYLPEKLKSKEYYKPRKTGFEKEILNRMNFWKELKEDKSRRQDSK
ncbi:MAG: replication-associated recombination protein A [bacterium]